MARRRPFSMLLTGLGWKRLVPLIIVVTVAIGLLSAQPWDTPAYECALTVRPGESIQEAIDAADAGAVICLGRGVWTESIVIDKPLTLVGRGAGRTVIEADQYFAPVVEVSGWDADLDVRIEGIAISGAGGWSGVAIGGGAAVVISDCSFSGRRSGITATDSAHLTVSGSTISESTQHGVVLSDSARADISDSRVRGSTRTGLWISGSAEARLADCEITGNGEHGFWLSHEATIVLTDTSVSRNNGHGLWLTGQSSAQLLRSHIYGNSDQGISAEDAAVADLTKTSVLSNWHGVDLSSGARAWVVESTVEGNRWDGIRVRQSARAAVSGSTLSGNGRGLGLSGQAEAEITDCLIKENLRYGVFSWSGGEVVGEGNEFLRNGSDLGGNLSGALRVPLKEPTETAITWPDERYASLQEAVDALLPGGRLTIEPGTYTAGLTIGTELSIEAGDGQVTLQGRSGLVPVLSLVGGAELLITGATITGGSEGLSVSSGARVVLVGCTISENSQGINLSYSSSADMSDCSIAENVWGGVFVGGAAQARIVRCSVLDNGGYGVTAAHSAQVEITDSAVMRNVGDGGVILWGSCQAILEANSIVDNWGFGVATFQRSCFPEGLWFFRGYVSGSSNAFENNRRGDVCPPELGFLSSVEGGELDSRP